MADSTVKAVSPVITLTMDYAEATALRELLAKEHDSRGPVARSSRIPWALNSVQSAVAEGVRMADSLLAGQVEYVVQGRTS